MIMYVLMQKPPCTGPPATAVFLRREQAERIADDPWKAAGWCVTGDFYVEHSEVAGAYECGRPVYAAHRRVDLGWEVYRFIGLYSTWEDAEKAAGDLGAVNELYPQVNAADCA
jgi:hypothetical protein